MATEVRGYSLTQRRPVSGGLAWAQHPPADVGLTSPPPRQRATPSVSAGTPDPARPSGSSSLLASRAAHVLSTPTAQVGQGRPIPPPPDGTTGDPHTLDLPPLS